jgi:hypothetical protein
MASPLHGKQDRKSILIEEEEEEEWRTQGDDFRTFLGDFVASLTQFEFPAGSNP